MYSKTTDKRVSVYIYYTVRRKYYTKMYMFIPWLRTHLHAVILGYASNSKVTKCSSNFPQKKAEATSALQL